MLPKVHGVVRLTRDVEIRYAQSGSAIGNFGVASSEKYKTATGEQKEKVTFIDVTAFGRLGEICNQYIRKGSKIYIEGKLGLDSWTDQQGQKRSKHTITLDTMEMLDSKSDGGQSAGQPPSQYAEQGAPQATPQNNMDDPNRHNAGGGMNRPPNGEQYPPKGCVTKDPVQRQVQYDDGGIEIPF